MSSTKLFKKHFGGKAAVDLKHPNIEAFFDELNKECLAEDEMSKSKELGKAFPEYFSEQITVENCSRICDLKGERNGNDGGKIGAWRTVYDFCLQNGMNMEYDMSKNVVVKVQNGIESVISFIQEKINKAK